ncbi:MAG: hypothetical protein AAGF92_08555 [Myxococcota bacterium]
MAASSGPGIVRAGRPRRGDFSGLLARAEQDESALDGLLFAYETMPEDGRLELVRAVAQDHAAPGTFLGLLLTVEPAPTLRLEIAALARRSGVIPRRAAIRGDHQEGEVQLIQPGVDEAGEALRFLWNHNEIMHISLETRASLRFGELKPCDPRRAVDTLTPMFWRYLRRGSRLPEGAARFAGWFSLPAG